MNLKKKLANQWKTQGFSTFWETPPKAKTRQRIFACIPLRTSLKKKARLEISSASRTLKFEEASSKTTTFAWNLSKTQCFFTLLGCCSSLKIAAIGEHVSSWLLKKLKNSMFLISFGTKCFKTPCFSTLSQCPSAVNCNRRGSPTRAPDAVRKASQPWCFWTSNFSLRFAAEVWQKKLEASSMSAHRDPRLPY